MADHYVDDLANPLNHAINEFVMGQDISQEMLDDMISLIRIPYITYEKIILQGIERGELKMEEPEDLMYIINGLFNGLSTLYYEKDLEDIGRLYKKGIAAFLTGIQSKQ